MIVALLGVVMAAALLSRNGMVSRLPFSQKAIYAAIWAAIFIAGVAIVRLLGR
jgi:hypothetical protein